jgi:DNA polymerase-3 subunit delta'
MTDAPAPQSTARIIGQDDAVAAFDTALSSERMHHGWLLTGPRGVGKATFAWLASHALLTGQTSMAMDATDPVRRRITEGNEPRITLIARRLNEKTGKLRTQIDVEQVRDLRAALSLAAGKGDWRCVIIDSAEEMNPSAANALLKLLEEPPARVAFFLISHAPGRLLPTIRSRCRTLDFRQLSDDDLVGAYHAATGEDLSSSLVPVARGSVGEALNLASEDGAAIASAVQRVLAPLPARIDRAALHRLADAVAPADRDEGFGIAIRILIDTAARHACDAAGDTPTTRATAAHWADAAMAMQDMAARTRALNLDRRQALLDMVARMEDAAARSTV